MNAIDRPPFHFSCIVGGRAVDKRERISVVYPFSGEVIGSVPCLGAADVAGQSSSPPTLASS